MRSQMCDLLYTLSVQSLRRYAHCVTSATAQKVTFLFRAGPINYMPSDSWRARNPSAAAAAPDGSCEIYWIGVCACLRCQSD